MTENSPLYQDYKDRPKSGRRGIHRAHFHIAALVSGVIATGALLWSGPGAEATRSDAGFPSGGNLTLPLALPDPVLPATVVAEPELTPAIDWQEVEVKPGDTLSAIFGRLGLGPAEVHALIDTGPETAKLARLLPGQVLRVHIADGRLEALRHNVTPDSILTVTREADRFRASVEERAVETRLLHAGGMIGTTLFNAGKSAGLSDRLIMQMVGIFGWDVDFALDIREGDSFFLLFEERWLNGEKLDEGEIVAAEFVNHGRTFRAVRFTDAQGHSSYYDAEGRSMRKAFLRSPVDFRRISSRFQRERYHPVLGKKRPHRGVDYAASVGTPIKAAGDGRITFRGWKNGYGRTVIVQHGGRHTTLYAHMSKFRGGQKVGSRVRQGQVIGYVGKSGLATGPHLHYEFRIDGVHRNPLTVKLPKAEPIPTANQAAFSVMAESLLGQIDVLKRTQIALGRE